MANKRVFKKYVNTVAAGMANDMMQAGYTVNGIDREGVDKAIINVLAAAEAAIVKASIKFDKTMRAFDNAREYRVAKREFYKSAFEKNNKEFVELLNKALDIFNAAVPEEFKQAHKG